ncbi:Pentatricopeptide repeat-containing protein At2g34400 [Linum grandiflorum]
MLVSSVHHPNFFLPKLILLKDIDYALLFFTHLHQPNDYAFNVMIRGLTTTWHRYSFANVLALDCGRSAHSMVFKYGLDSDDHVAHSMITMYAKCGQLDCARKVFDEIPQRDLVSWNSMISGYAQMGSARKAMRLFLDMRDLGIDPNEMTLVSVLGACGDLGNVDLGRSVEEFVLDRKMVLNSYIGSALINMYGKCGDLVAARKVFDSMLKKDVVAWNAMITGYAQKITMVGVLSACASRGALELGKWIETYALERNLQHDIYVASALIDMYAKCGNLDDSVRVFESMPYKNEVSWNSMISALAFNCRPQEALSLFRRMTRESGAPIPDEITFVAVLSACVHGGLHFSCMVDLLARAGLLHEAWEFIEKMPGKPDEIVLGALLAACRKKKNEDVSERRGVTKTPGCSWIELESQVHEFHAGDSLPDQSVHMYQLLNEQMRKEGYVPKPDSSSR